MRSSSRRAESAASRHWLPKGTAPRGSMKAVAPLSETSWTMPGTRCRSELLTRSTSRPFRSVISCSWSTLLRRKAAHGPLH